MVKHKAKERNLNTKFIYACYLLYCLPFFQQFMLKGYWNPVWMVALLCLENEKEGDVYIRGYLFVMPPYFVSFTRVFLYIFL